MIRASTEMWKRRVELGLLLSAVALAGCLQLGSAPSQPTSSPQAIAASPSPDLVTKNYVALVHNYWIQYKTAEGDLASISATPNGPIGSPDAVTVCAGLPSQSVDAVNPQECGKLSVAMVAVHQKFLSDLNTTPAPPRFAADDHVFRSQLPKAIADMEAMISVCASSDKRAVLDATWVYADAMIPAVTNALDNVDPLVVHN